MRSPHVLDRPPAHSTRCAVSRLALPAGHLPEGAPLALVGFDSAHDRSQFGFFRRAFDASGKFIRAFDQQHVHGVGHGGKMCNRLGRARPYSIIVRVAELFHRLGGRRRLPRSHGCPQLLSSRSVTVCDSPALGHAGSTRVTRESSDAARSENAFPRQFRDHSGTCSLTPGMGCDALPDQDA
jgi:hypothetical protein